jgi:hypothetical protein
MQSYRIMRDGFIQRQSDLALIPATGANPDYLDFIENQKNGAEVLPFDYAAEEKRQEAAVRLLAPTYADLRRDEYPSIEEIGVALWELVVENRPEAAEDLQKKRMKIKKKYPKK